MFFGNRKYGTLQNISYQNYTTIRTTLMNELNSINGLLVPLRSDEPVRTILYGNKKT